MKKVLLGTSALCAVAAAGPAFAQSASEPIKLGLGGYWNSGYGYVFSQNGSTSKTLRRDDIDTDAIVIVKGSTKFDNGLTAGISVQIRATDQNPTANVNAALNGTKTPDTIKRSYGYLSGDWGQIRIGDDDDARRQKALTAPVAGSLFGANTPDVIFSNIAGGTNTTMRKLEQEKRISRLAYFSPTIAGFSFAVSYGPGGEKGGVGNANAPDNTPTNGLGQNNAVNNAISAALGYSNKFGDFSLDAYTGFSSGHRVSASGSLAGNQGTGHDNPLAIGGGAVVGWGPFKFGGAYEHLRDRDGPVAAFSAHQTRDTWDIGPSYTIGPFSVSVDWTRGIYQGAEVNASSILDVVSLATNYNLGPGVDVGAALDWSHNKAHNAAGTAANNPNGTGTAIMTGVAFSF